MDEFRGKQVVVLGLARSGESAARLLCHLGAHVMVSDLKGEEELKAEIERLTKDYPQVKFHLRGHPNSIVENADLIVKSPGVPMDIPILKYAKDKGVPVIDEVELAYRLCRAPIIAITGTKGKSTTSTLLGQILSKGITHRRNGKTIVAGNIGKPFSGYVTDLTENDLMVLEVSSFQLEATVNFTPQISIILNIAQDHFDRHKSIEDYAAAKYKIFANQNENKYTVLNADDPLTKVAASQTRAKVILFSSKQSLEEGVCVENEEIIAKCGWSKVPVIQTEEIRIPGKHNVENALAVIAVSFIYGADREAIREVLRSFTGLEHALELVGEANGVRFVNDSKSTNVFSLKAALESFDDDIILIMGGRDKGNDYSPVESLIQKRVKSLILIGESADSIREALGKYTNPHKAGTMKEAVKMSYSLSHPGDVVLLSPACASFDMFNNYAHRGEIFKEAVAGILK
jgi:UDP-N-acetylmuramoylalanine--D-glutamate ligase